MSGRPLQRMWSGSSIRPLALRTDESRSSGTATGRVAEPSSELRTRAIADESTKASETASSRRAAQRARMERTVDGHQRAPAWAVGVPSALRRSAICRRLRPAARSLRIRSTMSGVTDGGRPVRSGLRRGRAGRRHSASTRSSSSAGISFVPHGVSTVSTYGSTRCVNVERPMPSAWAAWVRVYASRSTC